MPDGRPIFSRRWLMMKTAFVTTASVMALCSATRMAPVLLRSMALRMGRTSMVLLLLRLEVGRRLQPHDAPGRIQARDNTREQSDAHRHEPHVPIQACEIVIAVVELAQRE